MALAPFPSSRPHCLRPVGDFAERNLRLRSATDTDLPALCALYASTRTDELAAVAWPAAAKEAFLDQQFALQHRHYVNYYPTADFLLLEASGVVVGRFYRWCAPADSATPEPDIVVDICLLPAWRGKGIGVALMNAAMSDASARGRGVLLHVHAHNHRARRLYERLGFASYGTTGSHVEMRWLPSGDRVSLS